MPVFGLHPAGLLETIFEQIGVGVTVLDQQEKLVFANRTAIKLLGEPADGSVTFRQWRSKYRLEGADGREMPIEDSAVMQALRGERVEAQEVRATSADGSAKWLLTWAYPFLAMGLAGVIAVIVDETREVELRQAISRLQRMETLGAVAAGLTHNLNNVLNTIALSIASATRENVSVEECQLRLKEISAASMKAGELVYRLMQFGRTQELNFKAVQVNDVVADVLLLLRPMFRENVAVTTQLCRELPAINVDSMQLEQALVNLIMNALDAMPLGGELRVSTALVPPNKGAGENMRSSVSITVGDTGVGIPKELQAVIFDPFFTTKAAGKGTGLGLSSVYGIVKQHSGTIDVQSAPGAGTVFVISLPVEPGVFEAKASSLA